MRYALRPDGSPARLLVTGASDGIGASFVQLCGSHPAVLLASRPESELPTRLAEQHRYCRLDLSDHGARAALSDRVAALMPGGPDVAVLIAGTARIADFASVTPEEDRRVLEVNTTSALVTAASLVGRFAVTRIVFVSSVVARAARPGYASYGISKAALEGLVRSLRSEWEGSVSVGVFRPGNTNTRMAEKAAGESVFSGGKDPAAVARRLYGFVFGNRTQATDGAFNRLLWAAAPLARMVTG